MRSNVTEQSLARSATIFPAQIAWLLIGLLVTPAMSSATSNDRQVSFKGADGVTISGTLEPARGKPTGAAMLLVAGSGPTDRDGNQPPSIKTDLLKQIARGLADRGIVTLRFDKRGMYANTADLPVVKSKYGDFFSWKHFVADAAAGYRFVCQQPGVDPARVGILGHSEGGLLALEAAQLLKTSGPAPAVLVLVSTPGRSIDMILDEQLKALLARQRATPQQRDYFLGENSRIIREIQNTGHVPTNVPPGLKALYPTYLGSFLHSELAVDPCKSATRFSGPVLVINGEADLQVSADRDANALDKALAARPAGAHQLAIISKASHNLKIVSSPTDSGFEGPVASEALDRLQDWAGKALSAN